LPGGPPRRAAERGGPSSHATGPRRLDAPDTERRPPAALCRGTPSAGARPEPDSPSASRAVDRRGSETGLAPGELRAGDADADPGALSLRAASAPVIASGTVNLAGSRSPRSAIPAVLALGAALAAQVHAPLFLRAPLGYLLLGVIPGWALAESLLRAPGTTPEERAMASLTLSIPAAIAGRTLAFALGMPAPAFLWAWAVLCAAGCVLVRPRP